MDNTQDQEKHVCMLGFYHRNLGSRVLLFLAGCGLSNGVVGGPT